MSAFAMKRHAFLPAANDRFPPKRDFSKIQK
jgi:hypothetical protein